MTNGVVPFNDVYRLAATALAIGVVGAYATWWGRRGRRIGAHPHCRPCGYDLSGLDASVTRCPECGGELARPGAVAIGRLAHRPILKWLGALLLLSSFVIGVQDVRLGVRAWEVEANRPVWWLRRQLAAQAKPADRDRAFAELQRRLEAKELWSGQMRGVARELIGLQGDTSVPWNRRWAPFIVATRAAGALPDRDWATFAEQAVAVVARCRPQVRRGEELPFQSDVRVRAWRGVEFWYEYELVRIELNGVPIEREAVTPVRGAFHSGYSAHTERFGPETYALAPAVLARAATHEGPQLLRLVFDVQVHNGPDYDESPSGRAVLVRKTVTHDLAWSLVQEDAHTVELLRSPRLDAAMRAGTGPAEVQCMVDPAGGRRAIASIQRHEASVSVAMSISLRAGAREWACGPTMRIAGNADYYGASRVLPDFDAERVDVILRPDLEGPRHTAHVTQIWGGELIFPNVPVKWIDERWSPIPRPTTRPHP